MITVNLNKWELATISQFVAARVLTYAGHNALGHLFPKQQEDMKRWEALFDKLKKA